MATDNDEGALYDSTDIKTWSKLKAELFQSDLLAPTDVDPKDIRFARRITIYRLMLFMMLVSVGAIALESLLLEPLDTAITWVALAGWLLLAITAVWLQKQGRVFVPPIFALAFNITLVLWAIERGADHQNLWLFPLMIGLAGLLPTGVALLSGLIAIGSFLSVRGLAVQAEEFANYTALLSTWVISLAVMRLMTHQVDELADLALSDPLTGAYNRRYLQPQALRNLADYQRYARLSSMLMTDIDHFKSINDTFGHAEGDRVLKEMVVAIDQRIRGVDMLFRLGGEEFLVLLSEVGAQTATKIAEELRMNIAQMALLADRKVTVSMGVCDVTSAASPEEWLTKVDEAMYQSKEQGRNRVSTIQPTVAIDAQISSTLPIWR